jgi:DNA mismatch repair protein MutL
MKKIITLDENTVKKIAAGEVVERPASVVKELIENSLDAGSDKIDIEIEKGGIRSIRISDNGSGMSNGDLLICTQIHTTSKIDTIDDLNTLYTFGFRGEALASIASVSELSIHSSNGEESNEIIVENGEIKSIKNKPRTKGTTIVINDVFRHLPARKKFLKTEGTEYRYILSEIMKIAIAYPEVAINLTHNDKSQLKLPIHNSTIERLESLFKSLNSSNLLELEINTPIGNLKGYIVHPNTISNDRSKQYLFLNKRFIVERTILKAIKDGYGTTISRDENPAFFLNLEIDPTAIDINIHPRKLEAKIDRINELFPIIVKSIKELLSSSINTELSQKFGEFNRATERHSNNYKSIQGEHSHARAGSTINSHGTIPIQKSFNSPTKINRLDVEQSLIFSEQILKQDSENQSNNIFQIFNTYIIVEKEDSIEIIDQHAADERVNFEKIKKKIDAGEMVERKDLLIPIILDLDSIKYSKLEEKVEMLNKFGFDIDPIGYNKIRINAVPIFSRDIKYTDLIDEIANTLDEQGESKIIESITASVACHSSIRAGRKLALEEMRKILTDLKRCDLGFSCPHGRPIIWSLSKYEIEKKFERKK